MHAFRYAPTLALGLLLLFWLASGAAAQDNIPITVAPISYGVTVQDTITEAGIYDWWLFNGRAGDEIRVIMAAQDGLRPLIGLLTEDRNLVARSEDGEVNGTVELRHTLEASGEFIVVATRVGNADGQTVGAYQLTLAQTNPANSPPPDRYREVTFDCNGSEATNILTLSIEDDNDQTDFIGVSVYGLAGFEPVLRTALTFDFEPFSDEFCVRTVDGDGPGWGRGDTLQLPGEPPIEITDEGVKTNFQDASAFGVYDLNLGALNDSAGRFVIVIDGMMIGRGGDRDLLEIGLGPLARNESVRVYALSDKASRLDTQVEQIDEGLRTLVLCDDAGRRDCADVPSIDGFKMTSVELDRTVRGGPFDGGIRLDPGTPDKMRVLFGGYEGRTYGNYAIVILGEYAGRSSTIE